MQNINNHIFSKSELTNLLELCKEHTLGEVDKNNVFARTKTNPKITGIAGDVIEQSVLGYPPDTRQEPDLIVDGVKVELKTTGIRKIKEKKSKTKKEYKQNELFLEAAQTAPAYAPKYEAKEPMSITAVSPNKIVKEEFDDSNFWHKLEHMLLVFYLYDSDKTVTAAEYANFPIKGYEFHEFSEDDRLILENDWQIVRDFIRYLQNNYTEYENEYPRISHELRQKLLYIDTAPKWPNPPRFRLKRSVVTGIVQEYFNSKNEKLPVKITKYSDIENKCSELTKLYKNKTIKEICEALSIPKKDINKAIGEKIVINMFGGKSSKMNKIDIFNKANIIGKTIILTSEYKGTEDIKFFMIDFNEIQEPNLRFEDSSFYNYFSEQTFLCIIFKEPFKPNTGTSIPLEDNIFLGFKKINFSEEFIMNEVKRTWDEIRDLVINKKLKLIVKTNKAGEPIINKTGVPSDAPNFPKSKTNAVFVRGTGTDSTSKTECVNGLSMYDQNIWIKRKSFIDILNGSSFLSNN